MKNIFDSQTVENLIKRINHLSPESNRKWGKMTVDQMLAHCNVSYEMIYDDIHQKPNFLMKILLKAFVKNKVVSEKPFPKNGKTAPQFIIKESKDFEKEKQRLIHYLKKTQKLGGEYFDGRDSHSFGALTKTEWNNMLYKHLDHHLTQFGV